MIINMAEDRTEEKLIYVPLPEFISAKDRKKLSSSEIVSHAVRGERIRATITWIDKVSASVWMLRQSSTYWKEAKINV